MDALGLVRQDHRRLEALLERCERTDSGSARERAMLVDQLRTAVRHHVDQEEALLYPAFRRPALRQSGNELVARATDQHRRIASLANELAATPPGADAFQPTLHALADQVREHLDTEDATVLTALEDLLDDEALLDLGRRLENRQHVVAAQEQLSATTSGVRGRAALVAAAAAAAALTVLALRHRRRTRP